MQIKKTVYWLAIDDGHFNVRFFPNDAARWAAMAEIVKGSGWPELAEEMRNSPPDDPDELWSQFTEEQQHDACYYNYGDDTLEIELTPEDLK